MPENKTPALKSLSLIVNFHRERILALRTLRLVQHIRESGMADLQVIAVLDAPDDMTSGIVGEVCEQAGFECHGVKFGNLGKSRQFGVGQAKTELIAFLDGDDLVSPNWLPAAREYLSREGGERHIAHSEYFAAFDRAQNIRLGIDSRDPDFDPSALIFNWFFCNNLMCHAAVLDDVPIRAYDHTVGIGAEDWHWSAETLQAGYDHVIIPDTAYFYRVKPGGESLGSGNLLPWPSRAWMEEPAPRPTAASVTAVSHATADHGQFDEMLVRSRLKGFVAGICDIEPALRCFDEASRVAEVFQPAVDPVFIDLAKEIYAEKPKQIALVAPSLFRGDAEKRMRRLRRALGADTLVLANAPFPEDGEVPTGLIVPPTDPDIWKKSWKYQLWFARLVARLAIDFEPARFVLQPDRGARLLIDRYALQIESFAREVLLLDPCFRADAFFEREARYFAEKFNDLPHVQTLSSSRFLPFPSGKRIATGNRQGHDQNRSRRRATAGIAGADEHGRDTGCGESTPAIIRPMPGNDDFVLLSDARASFSGAFGGAAMERLLARSDPAHAAFIPSHSIHLRSDCLEIGRADPSPNAPQAMCGHHGFVIGSEALDRHGMDQLENLSWADAVTRLIVAVRSGDIDLRTTDFNAISVRNDNRPDEETGDILHRAGALLAGQ